MAKKTTPTEPKLPKAEKATKAVKSKTVKSKTTVAKETKPAKAKKGEQPAIIRWAVEPYSRFTDFDISLFKSGKHYKLYEKFGSHVVGFKGVLGLTLLFGRQMHNIFLL